MRAFLDIIAGFDAAVIRDKTGIVLNRDNSAERTVLLYFENSAIVD